MGRKEELIAVIYEQIEQLYILKDSEELKEKLQNVDSASLSLINGVLGDARSFFVKLH